MHPMGYKEEDSHEGNPPLFILQQINVSGPRSDDSACAYQIHTVKAAVADAGILIRSVDDGTIACIDRDMIDSRSAVVVEYQVTWCKLISRDLGAASKLGCRIMRKRYSEV